MKVCLASYLHLGLGSGGLQSQLEQTEIALAERRIAVERFNAWNPPSSDVDLVHIFGSQPSLTPVAEWVKSHDLPLVWSPIASFARVGTTGALLARTIGLKVPGAFSWVENLRRMSRLTDVAVYLNEEERLQLRRVAGLVPPEDVIIPNGIRALPPPAVARLRDEYSLPPQFVVLLGSVYPLKNQLRVLGMLAASGVHAVVIGGPTPGNERYFDACRTAAGSTGLFLGALKPSDWRLSSALAGAQALVIGSHSEVMPLALYEALALGCPAVCAPAVPVDPLVDHLVERFSLDRRRSLLAALARVRRPSEAEAALIRFQFSWGSIARSLETVYADALSKRAQC